MSDEGRSFRWEQLDQRLLRPKLDELSEEMQKRSVQATNKAASDTRKSGNTAAYFPHLFEAQRQLTDQWAQKLYDIHCEVWQIQGNTVTPEFIRTVGKKAVTELIVTRKGTVEYAAQLWCTRKRYRGHIPLGSWARTIIQLRSRWVNKLEAEAVALEYRARRRVAISTAPPPPVVRSSYVLPEPKPTVPLDCLPPYYPASLTTKTHLVICSAVKKFPFQTHLIELCKCVLTKLMPHLLDVVKSGELKQNLALTTMLELIRLLLVRNCDSDSRRSEFEEELLRSAEWFKLAKGVARVKPTARTEDGRATQPHPTQLARLTESATNFLRKELTDFRERRPIPHYWRGRQGARTLTESQQEYDEALHFLQRFPTHWKESSLARIKDRFGLLITVAQQQPQGLNTSPTEWARSKAKEIIEEIFSAGGFVTDRAINTWLCDHLQIYIDEAAFQSASISGTKIAPSPNTSVGRRPKRPINPRKELIASIKARNPDAQSRRICELIDQRINKEATILQGNLAPLVQWGKRAPGERSWVGFYDHTKTHNLVKSFVNKVPPLKTSK